MKPTISKWVGIYKRKEEKNLPQLVNLSKQTFKELNRKTELDIKLIK